VVIAGASVAIGPGFSDPVHGAQQAFRRALEAMANPGRAVAIEAGLDGPAAALQALLLALTDFDTPVWWQSADDARKRWLAFHNGAPVAQAPSQARFAVIAHASTMPAATHFATGSAEAPETSTTLLIHVPSLDDGPAMRWTGPGIEGARRVRIDGLSAGFWAQWQDQHARFPLGVDAIFCCGAWIVALPRTVQVRAAREAGEERPCT
jgi:alpha-D-ribose 1-methylphosphonate 5-triphosphate synthase subunit PhnH